LIQVLSYNSRGDLTIAKDGKRYTYFEVSPRIREDVERKSQHGQVGTIMELLKRFSRKDLFVEKEDRI